VAGRHLQGLSFVRGEDVPFCASNKPLELAELMALEIDADISAVVLGFHAPFNYRHLCYATAVLRERAGCLFVATNMDSCDRLKTGRVQAGTGCWVAAVQTGSGVRPVRSPRSQIGRCLCTRRSGMVHMCNSGHECHMHVS
jgi:ribonucleotide monophosphatase NagD (HAD superfamily)